MEETTTQDTSGATQDPKDAAAVAGASTDANAASPTAATADAGKTQPDPLRKVYAALSAKERKILEREQAIAAREKELDARATEAKAFAELKEALGAKKAKRVFELLGTDYLSLSEMVASDEPEELTIEEQTQRAVAKALEEREAASKKAEEERKAAEAKAEAEALAATKVKYREALVASAAKDSAKYKTVAALGEPGIDLAYSLMETALEKEPPVVLSVEECLSLAEKHFASKLGAPAEEKQETTAAAEEAAIEPPNKTATRVRILTNAKVAQPNVRTRGDSSLEDKGRRLMALLGGE